MIAAVSSKSPFAQTEIENDHREKSNARDRKQEPHERVGCQYASRIHQPMARPSAVPGINAMRKESNQTP